MLIVEFYIVIIRNSCTQSVLLSVWRAMIHDGRNSVISLQQRALNGDCMCRSDSSCITPDRLLGPELPGRLPTAIQRSAQQR